MNRTRRLLLPLCAGAVAVGMLASGCAADDGGASATGSSAVNAFADLHDGMINLGDDEGDPVRGGTLSFAGYGEPSTLDPAKTIAAVTTGGVELANIYDTLMRYDTASGTYKPQLAKGLAHSDDYRTWTLTLRDGVSFSDGTPLDAAAVKASQERYAAAKAPEGPLWNDNVAAIDTPDAHTVVYTLTKPWPGFAYALTSGPGMIVAASAGAPGAGFHPVGAGPFTLDKWEHGNAITLSARADYWGGAPNLDAVKFVYFPTTQVALETFFNGGVDMALVREPEEVQQVLDQGLPGYVNMTAASNAGIINAEPGRPGADVRVRKAMQLAIDPATLSLRAHGDPAYGHSELFSAYSHWHTDVAEPKTDKAEAAALVQQAEADGFSGAISVETGPGEALQKQAIAIEAELESVGFDVDLKVMPTQGDHLRSVAAEHDYDLAVWGLALRDSDPYPKMLSAMHSGGTQLYGMHTSPAMDALIDRFQAESDDAERVRIAGEIQRQVDEDAPFVVFGYNAEDVAWSPDVHGVTGTSNSMVLLGKAWKS